MCSYVVYVYTRGVLIYKTTINKSIWIMKLATFEITCDSKYCRIAVFLNYLIEFVFGDLKKN